MAKKEAAIFKPEPYLEIGRKTSEELEKIYKEWDYQYKPERSSFISVVNNVGWHIKDFVEYLLEIRAQAYYAQSHPACDIGFNILACLIYIAIHEKIKTPFDHILNSDKGFEWKLNNLHEKKK
jgi:hypothetical protein